MYSKAAIALAAALSASIFAAPTFVRAESQDKWLTQQLQMTDGYAPAPAVASKDEGRSGTSTYEGAAFTVTSDRDQSDWLIQQLKRTDG